MGHKRPEIDSAVESFRSGLLASLGPAPTAAELGLTDTAVTLYLAVLLCQRKLQTGRDRQGNLLDQLPLLSGSLNRTLRTLGRHQTNAAAANDLDAPPPGATPEEKRAWSRRYVARCFAETREMKP